MATIEDAVQLVTDREYVVQPASPSEKLHELQVGRIVETLLERGAVSHDDARELLHEAVEGLGGRSEVLHPTGDPAQPGEVRLWIPESALRD
jgi:hypothetical protein